MKKFIISVFALVLGVALSAPLAYAANTQFNNDSNDLPTVMVANDTQNPCGGGSGAGCWGTSVSARPGDTVSVQVYYHNTGNETALNTSIVLSPKTSGASTSHSFNGSVGAENASRVSGHASVSISSSQTLNFIPGSVRWYPNQSDAGHDSSNENNLFNGGIFIGDIEPGGSTQGLVVAQFRVSDNNNNNNNDNNGASCSIDEFTTSPSTIDQGNSSTLRWNTSGDIDYVTLSSLSGQRSGDSSVSVSPYNTTSYTLRAYCGNGSTRTSSTTVYVRGNESSAPQAITTIANVLNGTQARLNGIAIPHTTNRTTTAWFEWGVGGFYPNRTNAQTVPLGINSYPYSDLLSNLTPGVTYTYRAVVQNQYGTAYGTPVSFRTTTPTVVQPTVRSATTVRNVVVAQSAASLLELRVESNYDRMCVNGLIDYTITYKNISGQTLQNAVLQFTNPTEITYLTASRGEYNVVDRTMTIALGAVAPGEQGIVTVHARINDTAVSGNLAVASASVVYTNSKTNAQEDATAYSLITVSNDCPAGLGASAFGFGSFLPNTLLGWLLLILVILALIVLARQFQKKPSA